MGNDTLLSGCVFSHQTQWTASQNMTPPTYEERKQRRTITTKQLRDTIIIPYSNFKSSFYSSQFLQKQFLFDETKKLCRDRMSNFNILL